MTSISTYMLLTLARLCGEWWLVHVRYFMSTIMRSILHVKVSVWKYLYESFQMYLLDLGKASFQYLSESWICCMLLYMLHALTRSFVDEITLITLDSRQTVLTFTLSLLFNTTTRVWSAILYSLRSLSSRTFYKITICCVSNTQKMK